MLTYIGDWRYFDEETKCIAAWYVKPCLEWIKSFPLKSMKVFEYGAGDSSRWWNVLTDGNRYGVDDNEEWATKTHSFHETEMQPYIESIYVVGRKFDFVIIDGVYRDECTEHALKSLKEGGCLIIDNYHQASVDMPASFWTKTDELIKGYPQTIYAQRDIRSKADHEDWMTLVVHIYESQ